MYYCIIMKRYGCWIGHLSHGWEPDLADVKDNALKSFWHKRATSVLRKRRTRTTMNKLRRSRLKRDLTLELNEYFNN